MIAKLAILAMKAIKGRNRAAVADRGGVRLQARGFRRRAPLRDQDAEEVSG